MLPCLAAAADESFMDQFLEATACLDPAARGAYLEQPPAGAPDIDSIHQVLSVLCQTCVRETHVLRA